jgi:hypothetical protein
MTPEAPKKRRPRFARAVLLAILLGCALWTATIAGIYVLQGALPMFAPKITSITTTFICTRCGTLSKAKSVYIFEADLNDYRESLYTEVAPAFIGTNVCDHIGAFEAVGKRFKTLSIYPFKWDSFGLRYPDADFFSSAPVLRETLSAIAKTNVSAAQSLLLGVISLRLQPLQDPTVVLPALTSSNSTLLKAQLETPGFSGWAAERKRTILEW